MGERKSAKRREGWTEEAGSRASPPRSGHGCLSSSYCWKLDPICSLHLTLNEEDGDTASAVQGSGLGRGSAL